MKDNIINLKEKLDWGVGKNDFYMNNTIRQLRLKLREKLILH